MVTFALRNKTFNSRLLLFLVSLTVSIIFSTESFAGCGWGPNSAECPNTQTCVRTCSGSGGTGQCSYSCERNVGGGGGGGPIQCPPNTVVSWANPTYYCGRVGSEVWHRVSGCCAWSGGNDICGDFYACPTRNNKDKMCRDCEREDPFCYPYNAQVQVGTCVPVTPPQAATTGYIWEDSNGDSVFSTADPVWANPSVTCTGNGRSRTILRSATVNVSLSGQSAVNPWTCTTTTPMYSTPTYTAAATRNFTITPPNNYACSQVVWDYAVCDNAACTVSHIGSGTGCTATITNYSGSFPNYLNWRVNQTIPRTTSGVLFETSDPSSCNNNGVLDATGLSVRAFNGVTQVGTDAAVSPATGSYSISLNSNNQVSSVCVNGSLVGPTSAYQLSCIRATNSSGAAFNCSVGAGACAVNCTPTTALATGNATISFGFSPVANDKWFNVVDGDIYGDSVVASVAPNPLGGFSPFLINTQTSNSIGGFGFSAGNIDTQSTGTDVTESGGAAQRLSVLPSYPPTDQWLNKFSFSVPSGAETSVPSGNTFDEGKVYSFTVAQFNQILDAGSYSFSGGNSDAPAATIVYVTGSGSIDIAKNFVSTNTDKVLLLVTTADINITKDPGTTTASYTVAGASQIDLVAITQGDITFESQYDAATATFDSPLMVYGGLMASGTIHMDRNLGDAGNSSYPAVSVRFYPYLMSLIQQYEISSVSSGPYTGLATVDVQFDYSE